MSMAMEHYVRAVTVHYFGESRTTEVRKNFGRLAVNRVATGE